MDYSIVEFVPSINFSAFFFFPRRLFSNPTVKTMLEMSGETKKRKTETAAEKHQRQTANKLNTLLNKQKELLKKDIMKKRGLLDKALHAEIQV